MEIRGSRGQPRVMDAMEMKRVPTGSQEEELQMKMLRFSLGITRIRDGNSTGTAHAGCFGREGQRGRLRRFGPVQICW